MNERTDLARFILEDERAAEIELRKELTPVIDRISQVIPPNKVWEFFSSAPQKGGRIMFPYCRVDSALTSCREWMWMIDRSRLSPTKISEYYQKASLLALKALLWVEIGFEGLENLAKDPSSENWTSAVGHFVNDKERADGLMTKGAELYRRCLEGFVSYRAQQGISDDCFSEYKLEYLLDNFKTKQ